MGLFWSMAIDPALPRIGSFRKTTVSPLAITLRATAGDQTLATATIERLVLDPAVDRVIVRDDGLAGTFLFPSRAGSTLA